VREAYRKKGWAFNDAENIEQCKREGWSEKMQAQKNEGCRAYGYLEVNKVICFLFCNIFQTNPIQSNEICIARYSVLSFYQKSVWEIQADLPRESMAVTSVAPTQEKENRTLKTHPNLINSDGMINKLIAVTSTEEEPCPEKWCTGMFLMYESMNLCTLFWFAFLIFFLFFYFIGCRQLSFCSREKLSAASCAW
jgi:hypothetical protein